jgi:hypothetical protein
VGDDPARPVYTRERDLVPGIVNQVWYRAGVSLYPFSGTPHRLMAFVSNKSVVAGSFVTAPVDRRFFDRPIFFVEAEVKL